MDSGDGDWTVRNLLSIRMPLIILLLLSTLAWGQEAPKPVPEPTVKELQAKLAEAEKKADDAVKLLREYYSKYRSCEEDFTQWKVLGPPKPPDKK